MVKYPYESTSLSKLLQLLNAKLKGRPALSIALIIDGNQSSLKICSQKVFIYRDLPFFVVKIFSFPVHHTKIVFMKNLGHDMYAVTSILLEQATCS